MKILNTKNKNGIYACLFLLVMSTNNVFAEETILYNPSFDCSAVKENSIEYKICASKYLSSYDRKLDVLYKVLQLNSLVINTEELKNNQREWIQNRNRCLDSNCIAKFYSSRVDVLFGRIGDLDFSEIEERIHTESSKCLNGKGSDTGASRRNCIYRSMNLWGKEIDNIKKSIVIILEYLKITELVDLYHKLLLRNEDSFVAFQDMVSKISYNLDGTLFREILTAKSENMIAIEYRKLFLLRSTLFLFFWAGK